MVEDKEELMNSPITNDAENKYEKPHVLFIPLKVEERLMSCGKIEQNTTCGGVLSSS